ncbi:ROK family transcriptional regulator [Oceanispirochaeta sp. M1]|uniref:ROK family transcriptional regulator n=2 Tax=Oceanispirochaeta TaxID=2035349 RepID=UPI00149512F2|nr:ROK family transcriptional regulator [Oceanispirochaeta sp. M1]
MTARPTASTINISIMATQNHINNINMSRVLRSIWLNRGCSRADMCRELGLNKSTVTKNVQILLDQGIAEEIREGDSSPLGGRRPVALGIRQDFCYIMGLEIQTEFYRAVICNARGEVVFTRANRLKEGESSILDQFRHSIDELRSFIKEFQVSGIALGVSGVVNADEGIIHHSMSFGIEEPLSFSVIASEIAGIPVMVENDANCCCWGDLAGQLSGREENSLFLLSEFRDRDIHKPGHPSLSVGIGLVLRGQVHYGKDYSAGEFTSALREMGHNGQFSQDPEELGLLWHDKHQVLRTVTEIGRNIAFLVNTLNLSRIVIGGVLQQYSEDVKKILGECIDDSWPYDDHVNCQIEFSSKGDFTVAHGACGYYLEQVFGLPDVEKPAAKGWEFIQSQLTV